MALGIVAESDLAGNLQAEYVFFAGVRVARKDFPGGAVSYYFSDHLKSTSVVTDAAGNIKAESDYYAFGGELQLTNNDSNHYKFTGKERDTESGLDYFGARYYSNGLGRFTSPDLPFIDQHPGDPQSWNLYTYVRNNPLRFRDPTGNSLQGCANVAMCQEMEGNGTNNAAGTVSEAANQTPDPDELEEQAERGQAQQQTQQQSDANLARSSNSDKRTDVMLTPNELPPKPSVNTGVQSEMDYKIVPQANTMQQLQDNVSNLRNDSATQAKYSKMEVKLWESQRGEKWQWQGSLTGKGHDVLNVFAQRADQRWYIDGKRVQMVIGKDSSGALIKAWTVHVEIRPSGPKFSKVD